MRRSPLPYGEAEPRRKRNENNIVTIETGHNDAKRLMLGKLRGTGTSGVEESAQARAHAHLPLVLGFPWLANT